MGPVGLITEAKSVMEGSFGFPEQDPAPTPGAPLAPWALGIR